MSAEGPAKPDHRTVVAAQRRERTRRRLLEAAILVVAARGVPGASIDLIVQEAGLSRGTFYKYFTTVDQILTEAKGLLGEEMLNLVIAHAPEGMNPAGRLAFYVFSLLEAFHRYPLIARFADHVGLPPLCADQGPAVVREELLPEALAEGRATGLFCDMPEGLAVDFLHSGVVLALRRTMTGAPPEGRATVSALLRLLGLPPEDAARHAAVQVQPVTAPEDSLIARADAIRRQSEGC